MKVTSINSRFFVCAVWVVALVALSACKHETDYSKLSAISYSANIAPIINSNCTFSGCHGDVATQKFNLTTYTGLMSAGIEAGKPKSSKLYKTLVTLNSEEIMPKKPYESLTDKQIQLIYVWIGQGAKNN